MKEAKKSSRNVSPRIDTGRSGKSSMNADL